MNYKKGQYYIDCRKLSITSIDKILHRLYNKDCNWSGGEKYKSILDAIPSNNADIVEYIEINKGTIYYGTNFAHVLSWYKKLNFNKITSFT